MEEYVTRKLDQNIIDPNPEIIYTNRKLYRLSTNLRKSVGYLSAWTQWKLKIPSDGWGSSLDKNAFFTRAEMDRYIGQCERRISGDNHAYRPVPTGLRKGENLP